MSPAVRKKSSYKSMFLFIFICMIAGGGWWWLTHNREGTPADKKEDKKKGDRRGGNRPQPVSVREVQVANLPVWLPAIGTITPIAQVTVRSRVDGELIRLHFQEGTMVQKGQLLAEIDPRPFQAQLRQNRGQLTRDLALLDNARLDLARYRDLWSKDAIAKQQLDAQLSLMHQYQGAVEVDRGQVENTRLQLQFARITAPVSGRIGLRQVDQGNMVRASDASGLAVITQLQPIAVVFSLPEKYVTPLLKRLQGTEPVAVEVWNREQKTRIASGRLVATDSVIDTTTGSLRLKAELANENNELFPNQFVNVQVLLDTLNQVLVVPAGVIQQGVKGSFVYRIEGENQVKVVPVKAGAEHDDKVALLEADLKVGDRLVLEGIDQLREGAKVEVITPGKEPTTSDTAEKRPKGDGRNHKKQAPAGSP
ncbi:MAG: MdtA/MuxA family multidrug efflux RND transporter periplasmic adaptor subunit [Magnetococcales bacterium]|nr:MdtA/MuxA family multidrug efflux RND transporter periplasmic adaptor subunit [Magnetococcales bacterium]